MGKSIRQRLEEQEEANLHPRAAHSAKSLGRERDETPCNIRPSFQVDRDRILHSKTFRRLSQKTQVFLAPEGDHYRTRLTHTLEVAQIARTLSKALGLNESLTEAVALGHDLGHTPFGHAGESVLNRLSPGGFHHAKQSLRVVEVLERDGRGLNLTQEVREGILRHSKGKGKIWVKCSTLEAETVRVADLIAYLNHDLDDALRAGVIGPQDIPKSVAALGAGHGARISALVTDVIETSLGCDLARISPSDAIHDVLVEFRAFLYAYVYDNPAVHADFLKAIKVLEELYGHVLENPEWLAEHSAQCLEGETVERMATDFIAGMTDRYAIKLFESIFMPKPWKVL